MAKNKFKVGDKVIFHPELCKKSFYPDASHYTKLAKLKSGIVYTVRGITGNGDPGNKEYITLTYNGENYSYRHPYDVFTLHTKKFELSEKWCIKCTRDNIVMLEEWRGHGKNSLHKSRRDIGGYLCYNKIWINDLPEGYQVITTAQFKKYVLKDNKSVEEPKFTLPERWVVQNPRNEESKLLYDWFNKGCNSEDWYVAGKYFGYPNFKNYNGFLKKNHTSSVLDGALKSYTEITFEQFKEYVLGIKTEIKEVMEQSNRPRAFIIHSKSRSLIDAMFKELNKIGYTGESDDNEYIVCNYSDDLMLEVKEKFNSLSNMDSSWKQDNPTAEEFELPVDWDKALKFAEQMFNHPYWDRFNLKVGDYVFVEDHTDDAEVTGEFIGKVGKILSFPKQYPNCVTTDFSNRSNSTINFHMSKVRLATKEEVVSLYGSTLKSGMLKDGDLVVVIPSDNRFRQYPEAIGHMFRVDDDFIKNIGGAGETSEPGLQKYSINYRLKDIRLATPEEIRKYENPKISIMGYDATYSPDSVKFGCQTFSKQTAIDLERLLRIGVISSDYKEELIRIAKVYFNKK